ncbi:hypothetical protein RclHR1_00070052 [Rhizophagus clarus]|uniref:Uncharacterized protein n=1 Tax=Rhizophagus clarus TaxID=94130 RepID=A0A2Z6S743_9GLOM|nr:hypothetical protein RclHR1_00070052 [Rhizophagus clarus]GES78227.1 hypothetical protein GLOIN_2v1476208 [Rhizophagus clarus]
MKGLISTLVLILAVVFWFVYPRDKILFFQKFSITTNDSFEEINKLSLPAANTIMEHSIAFRKVANMIQRSPAFEFHGCQISMELRKFERKTVIVGNTLIEFYNGGSKIYKSINEEIENIINRVNPIFFIYSQKENDLKYFDERLNIMIKKIKEFKELTEKGWNSIIDVVDIINNNENNFEDNLKGAQDFINNKECDSKYMADITKAKRELEIVNHISNHLNNTKGNLVKMRDILNIYEVDLLNVSDEIKRVSKFQVTREDLKHLRLAVDILKEIHFKFIRKSLNCTL